MNTAVSEVYSYDGLSQLTGYERGTLNGNKDGNTGTMARSHEWDYDALGNWNSVTTDGGSPETRTHNRQKEITAVSGATTPTYVANGNMTRDETGKLYSYDPWNRLLRVREVGGSPILAEYNYDALGRRAIDDGVARIYSANWQVLEERSGTQTTNRYIWSPVYVDAMVARDRDTDANGTLDERLYPTHDANFNVTALLNTYGVVVERMTYDPFGKLEVRDAAWAIKPGSSVAWIHLHQGGRLDVLTGLYHFRSREYSPTLGRWVTMDPIRFEAGDINFYRMVANNPINLVDPRGLEGYNPYSQHWHHLYPQAVFKDLATGVDINAAENGYILFAKDHIGEGGIHSKGWNKDWEKWVQNQKDAGLPINKDTMKAQLDKMMVSEKYKGILANGKPAKASYGDWGKKLATKLAALKAARNGLGSAAKKVGKKIPMVGIGVTLFFWREDVRAKGVVGGTVNSALDAVPFLGIGKGVIELGTGDLIPDQEQIYDGGDN